MTDLLSTPALSWDTDKEKWKAYSKQQTVFRWSLSWIWKHGKRAIHANDNKWVCGHTSLRQFFFLLSDISLTSRTQCKHYFIGILFYALPVAVNIWSNDPFPDVPFIYKFTWVKVTSVEVSTFVPIAPPPTPNRSLNLPTPEWRLCALIYPK